MTDNDDLYEYGMGRKPESKRGVVHRSVHHGGTLCRDTWEDAKTEPRTTWNDEGVTCRTCRKYLHLTH